MRSEKWEVRSEKWRVGSVMTKRSKEQGREKWEMKCSDVKLKWNKVTWFEVKWNELGEVMIWVEMCVLSLIYIYVAVCRFCAVSCVIIICFSFLFTFYVYFPALYVCFLFCAFVLFCVLFTFVYSSLFPVFVQVYQTLPPSGNPTAVNKYHHHHHHHHFLFVVCVSDTLYLYSLFFQCFRGSSYCICCSSNVLVTEQTRIYCSSRVLMKQHACTYTSASVLNKLHAYTPSSSGVLVK
jgi:hypothetical protein